MSLGIPRRMSFWLGRGASGNDVSAEIADGEPGSCEKQNGAATVMASAKNAERETE
jgi:hypothetical protein